MKEVILSQRNPTTTVLSSEVCEGKFYGTIIRWEKGFISRTGYNLQQWYVRAFSRFTECNSWPMTRKCENSLTDYVEYLKKRHTCQVFEFDTLAEMAEWGERQ